MKSFSALSLSLSCLFAVGTVACGPTENADVNEVQAKQQVQSTVDALRHIQGGQGGEAALGSLMSFGSGSSSILTPQVQDEKRDAMMQTGLAKVAARVRSMNSEGCKCDENKCVFTDCEMEGGTTIEGQFEWTDESLKCDYKVTLDLGTELAKMKSVFATRCDLKFSETTLDGSLSNEGTIDVDAEGEASSVAWDTSYVFTGIKFDDKGISKGKATVEANVSANGKEALHGKAEIDFSK